MAKQLQQAAYTILKTLTRPFQGWGLTRWYPFRIAKQLYKGVFGSVRPEYINLHGAKLYLDPLDSLGLLTHGSSYEPTTTNIFKHIIRPANTVVDIGAHIGYYTLLARELCGRQGQVFSFEPNPESFSCLTKTVAANKYQNITAIQKALSDSSKEHVTFFASEATSSLHNSRGGKRTEVETTTLDLVLNDYKKPIDVIKIDVEGAEPAVLAGAQNILNRNPQMKLIIEFNPELLESAGTRPESFLENLHHRGLAISIIEQELKPLLRHEFANFAQTCLKNRTSLNLFCQRV